MAPHCARCSQPYSGTFAVADSDGAPLGLITRRPGRFLPWPRRIRWTFSTPTAPHSSTAKVGTWYAWLFYLLLTPLWLPWWLFLLFRSLFDDGSYTEGLAGPKRTRWHAAGTGVALDKRGINATVYHLQPQRLDYRLAYAQAVVFIARASS